MFSNHRAIRAAAALAAAGVVAVAAHGQQDCPGGLSTGLSDLSWEPFPRVRNDFGTICSEVCSSDGFLHGTACFKWGSAFQCTSSSIQSGQSQSLSGGFSAAGFSASASVTYTASQSFTCDATENLKCQFFVCHDLAIIRPWDCQTFYPWGTYDSSVDDFSTHQGTTVVCCCEEASCMMPPEAHPPADGDGAPAMGPPAPLGSILVDLSSYFSTFGPPPPGHPIAGPSDYLADLTEWHLCEIQRKVGAMMVGAPSPINELVIMDVDGTTHHFDLEADPFPFLSPDDLTQNASLEIVPGTGDACIGAFGDSEEYAVARSYDLSPIPADYLVNCTIFGVEANTGPAISAMVRLYLDMDGGAPIAPGGDLVLIGEVNATIPSTPVPLMITAPFATPIPVPAGSVVVSEVEFPAHAGGVVLPGANTLGESGPTYFRSAACGAPVYVEVASMGVLEHFVQMVVGEPIAAPCPWDCGNGDGMVDVIDFLALLASWGSPGPCDFSGDVVDVLDFLDQLSHWGACP